MKTHTKWVRYQRYGYIVSLRYGGLEDGDVPFQ